MDLGVPGDDGRIRILQPQFLIQVQHGFRQAPNIIRALESELSFFAQLFGFALPADEHIEPVAIENLER
jgi:hypothetical protein